MAELETKVYLVITELSELLGKFETYEYAKKRAVEYSKNNETAVYIAKTFECFYPEIPEIKLKRFTLNKNENWAHAVYSG